MVMGAPRDNSFMSTALPPEATRLLAMARETLQIEAEAVTALAGRLDERFADAVRCLLACTGQPGVYNVADSSPVVLETALRDLMRERGLDVRIRYLPLGLAWSLAAMVEPVWRLTGRAKPPRLTRYAISHLASERTLDITAAQTRLGYKPAPTSFAGAATW